jgi:hypothetical protein
LALLGGGISIVGICISSKAQQKREKIVEKIRGKKIEVNITR